MSPSTNKNTPFEILCYELKLDTKVQSVEKLYVVSAFATREMNMAMIRHRSV